MGVLLFTSAIFIVIHVTLANNEGWDHALVAGSLVQGLAKVRVSHVILRFILLIQLAMDQISWTDLSTSIVKEW